MHEKTAWDRLAELFTLPPCGSQKGTELLSVMERLKPEDPELWFRWMYFSRLPEWIQWQLAEDTSPVRELVNRGVLIHTVFCGDVAAYGSFYIVCDDVVAIWLCVTYSVGM